MTTSRNTHGDTDADTGVADGHYARKQLNCRSSVIAFSHRSRFEMAVRLAGVRPQGRLLDYGSGDGTYLSLVAPNFGHCVGADIANDQVVDCRMRFANVADVSFCEIRDLHEAHHIAAYDVVTCMEVLEHCPAAAVTGALRDIARLIRTDGTVIISVPIETGPSFLLKYAVRTVAGWRGLSDYRYYEKYTAADALRMITARAGTQIYRPIYNDGGFDYHSHYGFNWRSLRLRVEELFHIEQTLFTPFNVPAGFLSSQAWFVCRPRT